MYRLTFRIHGNRAALLLVSPCVASIVVVYVQYVSAHDAYRRRQYSCFRSPSSLHTLTLYANPGIIVSLAARHRALPSNQSVSVTTGLVLSNPPASSACSIVWFAIRPSESKEKMNRPVNVSEPEASFVVKRGLSPPRRVLRPRFMPPLSMALDVDVGESVWIVLVVLLPLPFLLGSVRQRTTSFSSLRLPDCSSSSEGAVMKPERTIFSLRISSLTLPTTGTQPHATGAVKSAARYGIRPRTTGRCGCVEGKR